jgi:hypothetical protein
LRLPLPADFLSGLDLLLLSGTKDWPVVLLGRDHRGGVWFYFLVVWLLKEPVLILAGQAWGVVRACASRLVLREPFLLYLAINVALALAYFSLFVHAQIGIRFVLMCIVPIDVLAAAALAGPAQTPRGRRMFAAVVVSAMAANLAYIGNHLAFTSETVWPKAEAFRLLSDSNIDYGQNGAHLEGWLRERDLMGAWIDPVHLLPGDNVVSLNPLAGLGKFEQYRWWRENLRPRGHLGYTFVWFTVDAAVYERFLDESRRLVPGGADGQWCGSAAATTPIVTGTELAVPDLSPPEALVVCVSVPTRTDVALHGSEGNVLWGPLGLPLREHPIVLPAKQSWYRLEPGTSALVLSRARDFRGWWQVERGTARIASRPATVAGGKLASRPYSPAGTTVTSSTATP